MQVNITKRIDTPEGKRYCPVVVGPNGRIKPDWVMIDGHQETKQPAQLTGQRRFESGLQFRTGQPRVW